MNYTETPRFWVRISLAAIFVAVFGLLSMSLFVRTLAAQYNEPQLPTPLLSLDDPRPDARGLLVTCVDCRISEGRLLGTDTGRWYIYRVPGPIVSPELVETIHLLAVHKGVGKVVLLGHSDCAAMKLATRPDSDEFPRVQFGARRFKAESMRLDDHPTLAPLIRASKLRIERLRYDLEADALEVQK